MAPVDKQTLLTLTITNFSTEPIRKNLEFYWRGSIVRIKKMVEGGMALAYILKRIAAMANKMESSYKEHK